MISDDLAKEIKELAMWQSYAARDTLAIALSLTTADALKALDETAQDVKWMSYQLETMRKLLTTQQLPTPIPTSACDGCRTILPDVDLAHRSCHEDGWYCEPCRGSKPAGCV